MKFRHIITIQLLFMYCFASASDLDFSIGKHINTQGVESTLLLVALLCMITLSVLAFFYYSKRKKASVALKRNQLELEKVRDDYKTLSEELRNTQVEFQERQAFNQLVYLKEKQELLNGLKLKVSEIDQKSLASSSRKVVLEMETFIIENFKSEEEWQSFVQTFEKIHPSFFEKISIEYPELSRLDRRLISYLKMDLSSKEISHLMGVNHNSVNKSRYRLRKKMNVPKEVKLVEFLAQI